MDLAGEVGRVVAYNEWANTRILDTAGRIDPEMFADGVGLEIVTILRHLVGVQLEWRAALNGQTSLELPPMESFDEVREAFRESHAGLRTLAGPAGAGWFNILEGIDITLGTVLVQLLVHGVQHRAEVGLMLNILGLSPGDLDYLFFISEMGDQTH